MGWIVYRGVISRILAAPMLAQIFATFALSVFLRSGAQFLWTPDFRPVQNPWIDLLRRINREQGVTVLFIEQNVELALSLARRGYVLESGRTVLDGPSRELLQSPEVRRIFLGG